MRRAIGFLDAAGQLAMRLFGRAQLAHIVPTIAARQRKVDDARGLALNPARVKSLVLNRNQGSAAPVGGCVSGVQIPRSSYCLLFGTYGEEGDGLSLP